MEIGIITGSGTYALPGFEGPAPEPVRTPWGDALASRGTFAGVRVAHVSRHGEGHVRLSNHIAHRAHLGAFVQLGVDAVIAVTVCGAVDPNVELGSLICFDDLHFPANRLADGSLCTLFEEPGDPRRGHWIYADPYAPPPRPAAGADPAPRPAAGGDPAALVVARAPSAAPVKPELAPLLAADRRV